MINTMTYEAFRDVLNDRRPGWMVKDDEILGPDGAAVRLTQRHDSSSEGHVDVQFVLDVASPQPLEFWDCVTGFGETPVDRARSAAHLWSQTTAGALLELKYSRRGEFADHYHGDEIGGFPGWHVIAGAILGFGHGESPNKLQRWWLDNPVLPTLAHAMDDGLDDGNAPYGLKILFGGHGIAEVRVDGERHESASLALANLPWPRLSPPGFVRSYVIVLDRDDGGSATCGHIACCVAST